MLMVNMHVSPDAFRFVTRLSKGLAVNTLSILRLLFKASQPEMTLRDLLHHVFLCR